MNKAVLPLLFFAGDCMAHPGHGARLLHLHDWDWASWAFLIAAIAVAAGAVWRVK